MANDRLFICCDRCGKFMMIAKQFGGEWNMVNYDPVSPQEKLQMFFVEHFISCSNNSGDYSFVTEMDDDLDWSKWQRYDLVTNMLKSKE